MGSNLPVAKQRIYQPKDSLLYQVPPASNIGPTSDIIDFAIVNPSARASLKVSLIWWQSVTGQPSAIPKYFDASIAGKFASGLWLATADVDETGGYRPNANIMGAIGPLNNDHTYQTVPIDNPGGVGAQTLAGWSQTFQDQMDGIVGTLKVTTAAPVGGTHHGLNISLRVRWEILGSEMCDDEWLELRSRMAVQPPQSKIYT